MIFFGTGSSCIVSSSSSFVFNHSNLDAKFDEPDNIKYTSVFNGYRGTIQRGDYSEFIINVNLFDYSNPADTFRQIYNFNHKNVVFYPVSGSGAIKSGSGANVEFYVSDVTPYYVFNTKIFDACKIKLKAINYTDLYKTVSGSV